MSENLDLEYANEQTGIPTFLKVLCILTFIGAGFGLLSALYSVFTVQSGVASLENSQEILRNVKSPLGDLSGQIEAMKKWGLISGILNLVGNGLCLFGAILMWKLKKVGFFLYVVGQIIAFVSAFLMFSSGGSGGLMQSMMVIAIIVQAIFVIAFVVMYAVNLKHLNK